ncbi:MAG: hypothetical protein EBU04_02700 [Verrucomicrobia bacterium]|nr:hypothetical protein [Verrucomicrobiota bacterium]NBS04008.1 hypothetical protein [Verrucomicrobiota bacterium]NBY37596.1 hypothetical protein [Verrucomicrobiota bacterium]
MLFRVLILFLGLLVAPSCFGHPEWKEASCIGVLDEQNKFSFTIKFDIPSFLLGKLPKDATVKELDDLMFDDGRLPAAYGVRPDRLKERFVIKADGKSLPVRILSFPSAIEVKAQSTRQGESDRYPVLMNVKAEVQIPADTHKIEIFFPSELGTVFTNLRRGMEYQVVMAVIPDEPGDFVIGDEKSDQTDDLPWYGHVKAFLVGLLGDGFGHVIPNGWDHCLFMMAMFLGAASLRQALGRSLIFTVGHSITLTAVALGYLGQVGTWIEPVIALTIGLGGLMAYLGKASQRQMLLIPATFGLVHGLGFAAAVSDRLKDWDRVSIIKILVGFNLGVELAQVSVILSLALVLALIARTRIPQMPLRRFLCLAVAIVGFGIMAYRILDLAGVV